MSARTHVPHFALIAALSAIVLALVPAALAAKGGGHNNSSGTSDSISLGLVTDLNGNGTPNQGDTVTFAVSATATTEPHARLQCFQDGSQVYSSFAGYYAGYLWPWLQNMTLNWASGAADCTAQLYYFDGSKTVWSASLSFHVDG
jgi:hypothetical protein